MVIMKENKACSLIAVITDIFLRKGIPDDTLIKACCLMYKTYRDKSFNFNVLEIGREKGGINPPKSLVIITVI